MILPSLVILSHRTVTVRTPASGSRFWPQHGGQRNQVEAGSEQGDTSRSGPRQETATPGWRMAMGDALTIGVRSERDRAIATVAGEIDISTVTRLRERLFELAASSRHLVIDLDQVTFIDSAGLSALVGTANQAAAHGTSVHVVCARPKILKVFRLTGLDRRLPPAPTVEEALAAPGPQPR
jgi:anti-sigma B factor antagonist